MAWQLKQQVRFDYNLLNMQSSGLPAVQYEHKLIQGASKSVLFAAVVATNLDHAADLEQRLRRLPTVSDIESLTSFLRENPARKLELVRAITNDLKNVHFATMDAEPVNVWELSRTLWSLQGYLGAASEEVVKEDPDLNRQLLSLRGTIQDLRKAMLKEDPAQMGVKLAAYQRAFFTDIHQTFAALRLQDASDRLQPKDLPPALRNRFIGIHGKLLIQVYPKKDVWDRQNQEEFVTELRAVDPQVTGTPVQLLEYTTLLKQSYEEAAIYSTVAITLLVFLHFRSVVCVLLSLLPVGIGWLWMTGTMGLFDTPFNPANIMTLPLVVGIGVTNGIHILNRFAEENNPGILAKSTGKAVLISGLTTIVGFGSLLLAQHQGISSLGFVMAVGVAACLLAGLTILPAIIKVMFLAGWRIKKTE
jgi:predicted RND superfamily exporter protein